MNSDIKKIVTPRRESREKAKKVFLAAFDARYPALPGRTPRIVFILRSVIAVAALFLVVFGGVAVYADTKNVPADSILYPWKRLSESVQLAFAPLKADAELHAAFAARRVAEINDLEKRKPTSAAIAALTEDANSAASSSIDEADHDLEDGALIAVCNQLLGTVATSSRTFEELLSGQSERLGRFTEKCRRENEKSGHSRAIDPSLDISSTASGMPEPNKVNKFEEKMNMQSSEDVLAHEPTSTSRDADAAATSTDDLKSRIENYLKKYSPPLSNDEEHQNGQQSNAKRNNSDEGREGSAVIGNQLNVRLGD